MDGVSFTEDLKLAYDMIHAKDMNIPRDAYRFFLPASHLAQCGKGLRLAISPKGTRANKVWLPPSDTSQLWLIDYAPPEHEPQQ
jgi:hypothetical protein